MPATDTERLVVSLEARVRDFEKNFQKANRTAGTNFDQIERRAKVSADRLESTMGGAASKLGGIGKAMAAGFLAGGAVAAVEGLRQAVDNSIKSVLEMSDAAKRAGVSFKAFQELKFVAEQNRVGIDSLTDGLKEMSLRADEFIKTGAGSSAEAFQRLGYDAATLAKKLKQPDQLFLEIIGKLQRLDKAAQIRVADEVFGGTGGEQFVQLIDRGEAGIRKQIAAANELGIVMDDQMIKKAEEVNEKFNLISNTIGSALKSAIVNAVSVWSEFLDSYNAFQDQRRGTLESRQAELGLKRLDLENQKLAIGDADPMTTRKLELQLTQIAEEEQQIVRELNKRVKALGSDTPDAPVASRTITPAADSVDRNKQRQEALRRRFLEERLADANRTDKQAEIDARADQIVKAANDVGVSLDKAAAIIQAKAELASEASRPGASRGGGNPLATARKFEGATEDRDSDVLSTFFKTANQNVDPRMTAWCAAFVNAALASNGLKGTNSNAARSFLNYGEATNDPRQGDIVVLQRGNDPSKGHVGFYDGEDEKGNVRVFGGNQSDGVNTKSFKKEDVLGYRTIPGADRASASDTLGDELSRRLDAADTIKEKAEAYRDVLASAREFIAEQGTEQQALSTTAQKAAALKYEQQMLNEATRAGIALTPTQRSEIKALAQDMATAETATQNLATSQQQAQDVANYFASATGDAITGLIDGSMTAEQAIQGLIGSIAKALVQAALLGEGPLGSLMGGSGGLLGSFFKMIIPGAAPVAAKDGGQIQAFARGGRVRGPGTSRSDSVPAWLSDGEHVVNAKAAGQNRELLESINSGRRPRLAKLKLGGGGGSRSVNQVSNVFSPTIPITVQASGNKETDAALSDRMAQEVDTLLDTKMNEFVAKQQRSGGTLNSKRFV